MKKLVLMGVLVLATVLSNAAPTTVFDNLPTTLPGNVASLGYQATQTSELGNQVTLAGTQRLMSSATITMSSWARRAEHPTVGDATGFDLPVTMNFYGATSTYYPGAVLGSITQTFHMEWRPDGINSDGSGPWQGGNGNQWNGKAFNITFDLSSLNLTLPDTFVYGVAYSTGNYGSNPLGHGPWESLNYGLEGTSVSVGTDLDTDDLFWNTQTAGWYTDGGAAGTGIFRKDTVWTGYAPMVQFKAVPEPGTWAALGLGGLAVLRRRRK